MTVGNRPKRLTQAEIDAGATFQKAYNNSPSNPSILTNATRGPMSIRRGSDLDADAICQMQDGAGNVVMEMTGEGHMGIGKSASALMLDVAGNTQLENLGVGIAPDPALAKVIIDQNDVITALRVTGGASDAVLASFVRDIAASAAIDIAATGGNPQIIFDRILDQFAVGTVGGRLVFSASNVLGTNDRLIIERNGNVLIGATTDAGEKLQIAGKLFASSSGADTAVFVGSAAQVVVKALGVGDPTFLDFVDSAGISRAFIGHVAGDSGVFTINNSNAGGSIEILGANLLVNKLDATDSGERLQVAGKILFDSNSTQVLTVKGTGSQIVLQGRLANNPAFFEWRSHLGVRRGWFGFGSSGSPDSMSLDNEAGGSGTFILMPSGSPVIVGTGSNTLEKFQVKGSIKATADIKTDGNFVGSGAVLTSMKEQTHFTLQGTSTILNTAGELSILPSVFGSTIIPAAMLDATGRVFTLTARGFISATASPTLKVVVKLSGIIIGVSALTVVDPTTDSAWSLSFDFKVLGAGSSGIISSAGMLLISESADILMMINTSNTALNLASSMSFDLRFAWGTASTGNSITAQFVTLKSSIP